MIFVYGLILLLSFYVLAKVVDDYFVASLDKLAEKLKMSNDAAGATLMAIGSSAPELFVALFAIFRSGNHETIGIGNIVGSAIFNLLVIIGASAIIKKAVIAKQAVLRDLFFYAVSAILLLFVLIDGKINTLEASAMILIYVVYIITVIKWKSIFPSEDKKQNGIIENISQNEKQNFIEKFFMPLNRFIGLFFPPLKYYFPVFLISILFIAGISALLVESAVNIARLSGISEAIIAGTILAAGTSVPDLISSLTVAKQGRGGMAISNAVGSNIFDVLIGLGLPFLLFSILKNETVKTNFENIQESVYFLIASVFAVLFSFILFRWKTGKFFGFFMLFMYVVYLTCALY